MRDHRKYEVWKKAHRLALAVYDASKPFPTEEKYGLTSQLRRAALSVPTNIVEGTGRTSEKEFAYFLNVSSGSVAEVEYLLEFAKDVGYLEEKKYDILNRDTVEVRKMLASLRKKIVGK